MDLNFLLSLFNEVIQFGGGFALLLGVSQLFVRKRTLDSHLLALLFFSVGFILIHGCLQGADYTKYPAFFRIHYFWSFLVGPTLYLFSKRMIRADYLPGPLLVMHALIPLSALALDLVVILAPAQPGLDWALALKNAEPYSLLWYCRIAGYLKYVSLMGYPMAILHEFLLIWGLRSRDRAAQATLVMIYTAILVQLIMLAAKLTGLNYLNAVSSLVIVALLIYVHLLRYRNPELFLGLKKETRKRSYEKSLLKKFDTRLIGKRLTSLMEEEKAFSDEDLSLEGLAGQLSLSKHQLSEFLNREMELNFNAYINKFRIKEACELLLNEPDRSILSIVHAVGFNSKSAFNTAFSRFTGTTPQQYRTDQSKRAKIG